MKSRVLFSFVITLSVSVITFNCEAQGLSDGDWQVIFNGKDLSGWQMLNGQHKAEVKDGIIVGTTVAGEPNGFLCTTEKYDDFILELEVKTDLLLDNSGIQFRSISDDEIREGRLHGYQAQIENRPPHRSQWNGAIAEEGIGWLYVIEEDPVRQKAYIQNQWNKFRIEAIGTNNRVWVNGTPTAHLVDEKYNNGFICLQFHGSAQSGERIYMRNVRIQSQNLQASAYDDIPVINTIPNYLSPQEDHQGFQLLFDGKTTKGWRGVTQRELPETGWEVQDGVLTISSKSGESDQGTDFMVTEKQYGPFELKFDFKLHDIETIVGIDYYVDRQLERGGNAFFGRRANRMRGVWKKDLIFQATDTQLLWNHAVIKAFPDNRVEYWLNGYKILEYQRDSTQSNEGHILLDVYNEGSISLRSIKIRELN